MPSFFKRAAKADQVANPPVDGSNVPIPQPAANPESEEKDSKNAMALTRTRTEDIVYPKGIKLALLMTSTFVSMFLVALVSTPIFLSRKSFSSAVDHCPVCTKCTRHKTKYLAYNRTVSSYLRPYHVSQTTSTLLPT